MEMTGTRIAKALGILSLIIFAVGLAFRAFIYGGMYIAPGDPHGLSDVVEFLLGWLLIGLLSACVLAALLLAVRGPSANRVAAGWLLLLVAVIALLAAPLHELAARWAI
jgi:hypothetical protein